MIGYIGQESVALGIVLERRPSKHPWADHVWQPVAVIPGAPAMDPKGPWRELLRDGETVRYHAGTLPLSLYRRETDSYRLNLDQSPPRVFVVLRREGDPQSPHELRPFHVTACPMEAQAYQNDSEDIVEPVSMPEPVVEWVADYVARHHVEAPKGKRKRRAAADPEAARAPFEPPPGSPPRSKGS